VASLEAELAKYPKMLGSDECSPPPEDDSMMDFESSGLTNQIYHTRTHLGSILQPGDTALGYFLTNANYNSDHFASIPHARIPDIILVKKTYPNRRKKSKARNWKLRSIAKEAGEDGETSGARGAVGRMGGRDQKKVEEDYEHFLRSNGLHIVRREILNNNCGKTWDLCLDIIRDKAFWALAAKYGTEFVSYLQAFQAMRAGFASGNFLYGLFVASTGSNA